MVQPARKGLGRGLSALMADVEMPMDAETQEARPRDARAIPLDRISANADQPRRQFDEASLNELATSISQKGILQPLILRPHPADPRRYQIVAGERRWRAAQKARLHEVPAIVRDFDDTEVLEVAIVENIQRADLNPLEEAQGYHQLMETFGHTQEKLAEALGKSRSHIANLMRLLTLPEEVQRLVVQGQLTAGHARALITAEDPVALARIVIARKLSVRETERLAKKANRPERHKAERPTKDADTRRIEEDLSATLGLKVSIDHSAETGGGRIVVSYRSLDDLDEICRRLSAVDGTD